MRMSSKRRKNRNMETLTQTINIVIGDGLANTGANTTLYTALGAGLIIAAVLFLLRRKSSHNFKLSSLVKSRKLSFRGLSVFILLALATTALTLNLSSVSAAPTLTLGANQNSLTVTVPKGGGTATTTTTLTSGTANSGGYTLTAALTEAEPGIAIKLRGGDVNSSTALTAGAPALTLKTTNSASSNDTTEITLDFTIDSTVAEGTKALKLAYAIAANTPSGPTLQSFTTSECSALPTYTGANEEAIVTLTDARDTKTYQVAKLADNHCWMLQNLKLGSTTSTMTLTPSDTNIASNFTLPQLTTAGTADYDNPGAYGPIPGDTGAGQTNYGYLYNWSAATAGESRTSHTETDGDAPYSICPSGWRLPTVGFTEEYDEIEDEYSYIASGDYSNLDISFGGTGQYADSGANIAKWQHDGPFRGVLAGNWDVGFGGQGGVGGLWSRSAYSGSVGSADGAYFYAGEVIPGYFAPRGYGLAVRCLLQQP